METNKVCLTPIEALSYSQNKLKTLPITIEQIDSVGQQVKEVIVVLEQLKQAIIAQSTVQEERNI